MSYCQEHEGMEGSLFPHIRIPLRGIYGKFLPLLDVQISSSGRFVPSALWCPAKSTVLGEARLYHLNEHVP